MKTSPFYEQEAAGLEEHRVMMYRASVFPMLRKVVEEMLANENGVGKTCSHKRRCKCSARMARQALRETHGK